MSDPIQFQHAAPVLASLDLDATVKFYTEKLGFKQDFIYPTYLGMSRGGMELHFWLCTDKYIAENTSCYVFVASGVDELYAEYTASGVIHPNGTMSEQSYGLRDFAILDGDGNMIRFGQETSEEK